VHRDRLSGRVALDELFCDGIGHRFIGPDARLRAEEAGERIDERGMSVDACCNAVFDRIKTSRYITKRFNIRCAVKPYKSGVRHDYKDSYDSPPAARERHWSWFALGLALPLVTLSLLLISERNESKVPARNELAVASSRSLEELRLTLPKQRELLHGLSPLSAEALTAEVMLELPPPPQKVRSALGTVLELVVQKGDTLERLFRRSGLSLSDLAEMVRIKDIAEHLRLLRPGDTIRIAHEAGQVLSLNRELDAIKMLSIARNESGFTALTVDRPVELRTAAAHGRIGTSLFEAGMNAGISDAVTMSMAGIFQWDIDFIQDVRSGDTFTVLYEEMWRDGVKLGNGPIIAAEFVNRGRSFRAARYQYGDDNADYFNPEGRSVRKAFIRAPVDFTRISSNFNLNRRHPVLNTIRAHRGVDYAAPTGTPVKAAGEGKITFRGVQGGYGNAVIVQHGGNITTLYAHLSRFGKHNVGSRVRQGDIIGYVGQSGLATGPHLHYEYRVDGVHRNPRTVPLPPADPVPATYRADFEATTETLWRELELHSGAQYATASQ
jgi:murein DD-endopeptidase MepM/ murein hydrolase activator NlpD